MKATTKIKNHYATLGVRPDASKREIIKARNKLLHRWHPDKNRESSEAAKEITLDILLAVEVLLNDKSRTEYDRIYRYHFPSLSKGKEHKNGIDTQEAREFIVCSTCGRKNIRTNRNYCMFCGAGIGENAKPFSWNDVDADATAFEDQSRESLLDDLFSIRTIAIVVVAILFIIAYAMVPNLGTRIGLRLILIAAFVLYVAMRNRDYLK
jgi:curved DNA-binding protein CbpA